jgi:hypothetical protein
MDDIKSGFHGPHQKEDARAAPPPSLIQIIVLSRLRLRMRSRAEA